MNKHTIQAAKALITLPEEHTTQIPCPIHKGKHTATLYQYPHQYAGVWECGDASGNCYHFQTEQIDTASNYMSFNGPEQGETTITVCSLCGVQLEEDA